MAEFWEAERSTRPCGHPRAPCPRGVWNRGLRQIARKAGATAGALDDLHDVLMGEIG